MIRTLNQKNKVKPLVAWATSKRVGRDGRTRHETRLSFLILYEPRRKRSRGAASSTRISDTPVELEPRVRWRVSALPGH